MNKHVHAVLHALGADPLPLDAIAKKARVPESDAENALNELVAHNLAIAEDGAYELTGPLSWFGSFAGAVKHHVKKHFVVRVPGDAHTHLYVDDVRVKGRLKAGDPQNQTVSVFACGRSAVDVTPGLSDDGPSCEECLSAASA
jgi:hypothetical protein